MIEPHTELGSSDQLDPRGNSGLAEALEALEAHLRRYVHFTSEHDAVAVALFCAGTHAFDRAESFPLLAFMSPVRRSGKTRALDVIAPIVQRAWRVVRPSEAVLFRKIDRDRPTLMLDETDTIWSGTGDHEGLRAVLNAGNRRGTTVARAVAKGRNFDLVDFDIYCPKVLAGIGTLPDTVRDRAIVIRMARKGSGDEIQRLRIRAAEELGEPMARALDALLRDAGALTLESEDLPRELDDRAQDSWEPLIAIADMAGGAWPSRARVAAIALSSGRDDPDDESLAIALLRDARIVFGSDSRLSTTVFIERLTAIELSPWNDIHGRPLTGRKLARLLRPFNINPERDRPGSFYAASAFVDAWARYLPGECATPATPAANLLQ